MLVPDQYDDGGISGGTLERPALQRMLADIEAGRVDVVVVAVGAQDPANPPTPDGINDRSMVMGGIDHHHLVVVADQPDVVVYLEVLAVQ